MSHGIYIKQKKIYNYRSLKEKEIFRYRSNQEIHMINENITYIDIPEDVRFIIKTLEERGFEAYAVGGCIRDIMIGRIPEDWDITTSALPAQIKEAFRRTVDTGIEHGTVTVLLGDCSYEVTTYRIDGKYLDNRHPEKVSFTDSVREDLRRRDFTVNAMAYNEKTGILDLFEGRKDLERGIVRCVGDADERFNEDALRILRAVRFAAQLDFQIEPETAKAISRHRENLKAVSKERILTELSKLICSAHIEKIRDIFELGLSDCIADCFDKINTEQTDKLAKTGKKEIPDGKGNPYVGEDRLNELNRAFNLNEAVSVKLRFIRFAFLCEGMQKDEVRRLLRCLKSDNDTLKQTAFLTEYLFKALPSDRYELKKIMSGINPELFYCLLRLKEISSKTALYQKRCAANNKDAWENLAETRALYEDILKKEEPVYLKELKITGKDLIEHGIEPGPKLGEVLKALLDAVHRDPEKNDADKLLKLAVCNQTV